jgi:hypothetical protein
MRQADNMNTQKKISVFVLMLMISLTVNAEKIYERTNSEGVAEFSDQPSADSEVVDVQPNIVEVVQPEPGEPRPDTARPASREQQGSVRVVGDDPEVEGSSNYYDDDERRLDLEARKRRVRREHRENNDSIQPRQHHKGAARGAGGHR